MTWTNVGGKSPGDALTAEIWNQTYANFQAMADGDSGAPAISVENALTSTGAQGHALVVGAGATVETAAVISQATGTVNDDNGNPGTITIPETLDTTVGSVYRWTVVKTTDVANYTLEYATGWAFRYQPTVGGSPPPVAWRGETTHSYGDAGSGDGSLDAVTVTFSSNQIVVNVNTDMDGDTFAYTVERIR